MSDADKPLTLSQHEFVDSWCKWCGAKEHEEMTATCLTHLSAPSGLRPEPARREYAVDDVETISAAIARLRAEAVEALNASAIIATSERMRQRIAELVGDRE